MFMALVHIHDQTLINIKLIYFISNSPDLIMCVHTRRLGDCMLLSIVSLAKDVYPAGSLIYVHVHGRQILPEMGIGILIIRAMTQVETLCSFPAHHS